MTKRVFFALMACVACTLNFGIASQPIQAQEPIAPPAGVLPPTTQRTILSLDEGEILGLPVGNRQLWVNGEFLFGFVRGANFPALATTSPAGTPLASAGILGAPGTETLFGGWLNQELRPGFRFGAGWWFGGERNLGVEAGVVFFSGQTSSFSGSSSDYTILGRPYIDANDSSAQAVLVSYPGLANGTLDIQARGGSFTSVHFDLAERAIDEGWFRVIALIGYRYYRYSESADIRQTIQPTDPAFIPGTLIATSDSFSTRNDFHGFDMGFRNQYTWDRLSLEILGKLAVGDVRRQVTISGTQTTTTPGVGSVTDPAGVLALGSNSGTYISHDWKVMPEVGATLQWEVRPNLNVRVGYSFLLLNGIVRTADQIDVTINPNLLPPAVPGAEPRRPAFGWNRSDMWIQSINLGVSWTF